MQYVFYINSILFKYLLKVRNSEICKSKSKKKKKLELFIFKFYIFKYLINYNKKSVYVLGL